MRAGIKIAIKLASPPLASIMSSSPLLLQTQYLKNDLTLFGIKSPLRAKRNLSHRLLSARNPDRKATCDVTDPFAALIPLARCRFISPKQFSRVLHRREHAIGVNQLDHGSAREGSRRHHDHHKPRVFSASDSTIMMASAVEGEK